jgi:predicted Zn-dependent peptidase
VPFSRSYIQAIQEIDAARVLEVARKYVLPDAYVMVAVGAGLADKAEEPVENSMKQPGEQDR